MQHDVLWNGFAVTLKPRLPGLTWVRASIHCGQLSAHQHVPKAGRVIESQNDLGQKEPERWAGGVGGLGYVVGNGTFWFQAEEKGVFFSLFLRK